MANQLNEIEKRLGSAAEQMWTNTGLRPNEYAAPVLGLLFLRYSEKRLVDTQQELQGNGSGRRTVAPQSYQRLSVVYLPDEARFSHLMNLPEGENIGKAINDATEAIEDVNEELKGDKSGSETTRAFLLGFLQTMARIICGFISSIQH